MNDRKNSSVIFVDDEEPMRVSVKQWLELADYSVTTYADGASALESFKPQSIDVLVTDLKMPEVDGFDVLERVLAIDAELPVIVVTAHGDVEAAVTAMKQGAYDFIEKPFSPEQLAESVLRASEKRHLVLENRSLRQKLTGSDVLQSRLIGNCKAIGNLRSTISDYAETGANILILGETGTGKEIVARCLHDLGPNPNENFVAVNCGAIPEHLFESEFFGYRAGAFTGAHDTRAGHFEHAGNGTLFFDEVTSLPLHQQVKILRVLEEGRVTPLGSSTEIPVSARFLSASNGNPLDGIAAGSFRQDLYFRINTLVLNVPPLRERDDDIILLFDHFLAEAEVRFGREAPKLRDQDLALLKEHHWPGNVRELKNAAERFLFANNHGYSRLAQVITGADGLKPEAAVSDPSGSLTDQTQAFERQTIEACLNKHGGNMSAVMEELKLPRRTLNDKMKRHGLSRTS